MRTITADYYTGFEGEPEITFVRRDQAGDERVFTLWYGYFYDIMQLVQPEPQGWTGLALPYHTVTGWNDEEDWQVPDVAEATAQLDHLDRSALSPAGARVLDELVAFMQEGMQAGESLCIQYF